MKHFKFIIFVSSILLIAVISVNFSFRQDNFISVVGKAVYNNREYPSQKVKVYVTEDGRSYQTFYCDEKGRFETKVKLNHNYLFHFSMDYHATSKVLVDTHVPKDVAEGNVGGLFSFDCELFERMDGLNLSILNAPLVKIKYDEEKKDFQYDKDYTEKILYNLEGFREQLAEMKQRRKEVLKDASSKQTEVKEEKPVQKEERKPIVFEEPKPKKSTSKSGFRNIMDPDPEEDEAVAQKETQALDEETVEEKKEDLKTASTAKTQEPKMMKEEEIFLEEEIDESDFISLNVIPKRVEIKPATKTAVPEPMEKEMEALKVKVQEVVESRRMNEEKRIRYEVTSLNTKAAKQRELHLVNKKIQTQRLLSLIKTVALAELYYKMDYYDKHPVNHNHFIPSIVKKESDGFWLDQEEIMVRYPGSTVVLKKQSYFFGITYFYKNGEEIKEDLYCSSVSELTIEKYSCLQ